MNTLTCKELAKKLEAAHTELEKIHNEIAQMTLSEEERNTLHPHVINLSKECGTLKRTLTPKCAQPSQKIRYEELAAIAMMAQHARANLDSFLLIACNAKAIHNTSHILFFTRLQDMLLDEMVTKIFCLFDNNGRNKDTTSIATLWQKTIEETQNNTERRNNLTNCLCGLQPSVYLQYIAKHKSKSKRKEALEKLRKDSTNQLDISLNNDEYAKTLREDMVNYVPNISTDATFKILRIYRNKRVAHYAHSPNGENNPDGQEWNAKDVMKWLFNAQRLCELMANHSNTANIPARYKGELPKAISQIIEQLCGSIEYGYTGPSDGYEMILDELTPQANAG